MTEGTEGLSIEQGLPILDSTPMEEAFGAIDEIAIETYHLFLTTTAPMLAEIDQFLASGNLAAAAETAHSAKGAARMTGAIRFAAVCGHIERCSKAGEGGTAQQWSALAPMALEEVRLAVNKIEL